LGKCLRALVEVHQIGKHGSCYLRRGLRLSVEVVLQSLQNHIEPVPLDRGGAGVIALRQVRPFGVRVHFLREVVGLRCRNLYTLQLLSSCSDLVFSCLDTTF
jgi:hypothetical protein